MATLAGQRAQFTWALNQYNLSEDQERRTRFAKTMAKYIAAAPANGFTVEDVTQGQNYPVAEVNQFLDDPDAMREPGISEEQARQTVAAAVDISDVIRVGEGAGFVYAYGYRCCPDRFKIGFTEVDAVQRIAAQIGTGTPDRPVLSVEIRTSHCRSLERAIQSILETRGQQVEGGGTEWFRTSREEILGIYRYITNSE
jgi:T5orf172 domain